MNAQKWTDEEKQILIELYHKGLSVKELSEKLGRPEGGIRGMKTKLGLNEKFIPLTNEEKQKIIDYYNEHNGEYLNLKQLSEDIGRSIASIERVAKENNLRNNKRKMTDSIKEKHRQRCIEYYKSEYYQNEIKPVVAKKVSDYLREHGHPKGFLGKNHSDKTREIMSKKKLQEFAKMSQEEKHRRAMKAVKTKIKNGGFNTTEKMHSRGRGFTRNDLKQYFRSTWEANIARILNHLGIQWNYEYKRFFFNEPINHVLSYQPDFYLPQFDIWIEVKGWMDEKSKIRLESFKNEFPDENKKLMIIQEVEYNNLSKKYSWLENWENI